MVEQGFRHYLEEDLINAFLSFLFFSESDSCVILINIDIQFLVDALTKL